MAKIGDYYKLTFHSQDMQNVNWIFEDKKNIPKYQLIENGSSVTIIVLGNQSSLSFLAKIIREINEFDMVHVSNVNLDTIMKDEKEKQNISESKSNNQTIEEREPIDKQKYVDTHTSNTLEVVEKKKDEPAKQSNTATSPVSKVREYILAQKEFSIQQVKDAFPDFPLFMIKTAIRVAKNDGLIIQKEDPNTYKTK